jgi:tRNA(fMet)-specific endonuclease VapC
MLAPLYQLDTSILLAVIRNGQLGRYIEATYQPLQPPDRPLLCIVSAGEIRSLAARLGWGPRKLQTMERLLFWSDIWDLSRAGVVQAYVDIDLASRAHRAGARNLGQNDLWIAAVAKVSGATLLTTDKDFDHLHPTHIQRIYVDPTSAIPPPSSGIP